MELWEYLEVLWRWGWVIVLTTALCGAVAIGFGQLQTPRYSSIVELNVTPARLDLQLSQTVVGLLRNWASSVESESMAARIIQLLNLTGMDAARLRSRIKTETNESEFRIKIEVTDLDPVFAQRVAQVAAELLVSDVQEFASQQDPLDRLTATMLNGGAQPATKTWPKNRLLAFLGVGGGLVLGLLVALGLEWARVDLVRTPQELEAWAGLPVLGSIPAIQTRAEARSSRFARAKS